MLTLTRDKYTVAWLCALPDELAASKCMLDEEHTPLSGYGNDRNIYTLGRIGDHNVVMTCLPMGRTGTNNAAVVATNMMNSFNSIRFGLMVGVGGGVPHVATKNIRLGDVVVSKPTKGFAGVVQYDFGKTKYGDQFKRTGSLNAPPQVLLGAISQLHTNHLGGRNRVAEYLSRIPPMYAYPGDETDLLFQTDYKHVGGKTCAECDRDRLVQNRRPRPSSNPAIHYGTIASGNQVMEDGRIRDELASELGALCFEMEAAGLMNDFPCLVIRGICDYADSHKYPNWKPYAAATAAAFAKDLLNVILPENAAESSAIPTPVHASGTASSTSIFGEGQPAVTSNTPDTGARETQSASTHASTEPKPSFFSRFKLFPYNSVALGRLVIDTIEPWHDFCRIPLNLTDNDVAITTHPRLRETLESARGTTLYNKIREIFFSPGIDEEFPSVAEKTYLLYNSGDHFKTLAGIQQAREWFEINIKYGCDAYMIVGIHTVPVSSICVSDLENRFAELNSNLGPENGRVEIGTPTPGEIVFAVQYRKVRFNWFSSRTMKHGFLNKGCNRWKVFSIPVRTGEENDEDDIVEAVLEDNIGDKDVDGDIYFVDNQIITI